MRENRALVDDSDYFSRTYATIAGLMKEQINWLLNVYMAHGWSTYTPKCNLMT
jgi:hypothetical protein